MASIRLTNWSLSLKGALLTFDVTGPAWNGVEVTLREQVLVPLGKIIQVAGYAPPVDEAGLLAWFRENRAAILTAAKDRALGWARDKAIAMAQADVSAARRDQLVAEIDAEGERLKARRARLLGGEIEGAS